MWLRIYVGTDIYVDTDVSIALQVRIYVANVGTDICVYGCEHYRQGQVWT